MSDMVTPVPKPEPRRKARPNDRPWWSSLRRRSKSDSSQRAEDALQLAIDEARERWGCSCIVPDCGRSGWHMHHAYKRGSHPELRCVSAVLFPVCRGRDGHHKQADNPTHWLHWALREAADECMAAAKGRRPWPTIEEVHVIIWRHQALAEVNVVSPIGLSD